MILIDDRAGSSDLLKHPPLSDPAIATICRLNSGDICLSGNGPTGATLIGIELKSLSDLISSCDTGRLPARQLPEMLRDYDLTYLLYYGAYRACPSTGALQTIRGKSWGNYSLGTSSRAIPYSYLESMLMTLSAAGMRIKHIPHARKDDALRECAVWVASLAHWWGKDWSSHKLLRTFDNSGSSASAGTGASATLPLPDSDRKSDSARYIRAQIASCLPGLGYERATAASRHFPSTLDMVNASVEEWAEVEVPAKKGDGGTRRLGRGLGASIAEIIRQKSSRQNGE